MRMTIMQVFTLNSMIIFNLNSKTENKMNMTITCHHAANPQTNPQNPINPNQVAKVTNSSKSYIKYVRQNKPQLHNLL